MAIEFPIECFKRVPFIEQGGCTLAILGPNWVGQAFLMQIRNNKGDFGTPLVSLTGQAAGTQGISATYDPLYIYNDAGNTAPATKLLIQIDETTVENLALNNPTNTPLVLHYDIHVGTGLTKRVEFFGTFTIQPGVSI